MILRRNIRVAIDFAVMLLVACKQHNVVKKLRLSSGDMEMKTHKV